MGDSLVREYAIKIWHRDGQIDYYESEVGGNDFSCPPDEVPEVLRQLASLAIVVGLDNKGRIKDLAMDMFKPRPHPAPNYYLVSIYNPTQIHGDETTRRLIIRVREKK